MNKCTQRVYCLYSVFSDPVTRKRHFRYNVDYNVWLSSDPSHYSRLLLNCQTCSACYLNRANEWALRAEHEMIFHDHTEFITLTYDDEHLPRSRSLVKRHYQLFFKSLRKAGYVFSYMLCGEYGSKRGRPHYHALLFGVEFKDKVFFENRGRFPVFTSAVLTRLWGRGLAVTAAASFETAAYIARYTLKKRELRDSNFGRRIAEFFQPSLKRPIGKLWFEKFKSDCFPSGFLVRDGFKVSVPRYYKKVFRRDFPSEFLEFDALQIRDQCFNFRDVLDSDIDNTIYRNEAVAALQQRRFDRLIRVVDTIEENSV